MSSTAVSKYRTSVKVSTAVTAAKTITAITKASPAVLTSSAHGLAVGTVGVLSGIVGMIELNEVAAVITAQDTSTFTLGGIDSTGFTTYVSGGTFTPHTMTQVENVLDFVQSAEEADVFPSTNLMSVKKEKVLGLSGEGSVTVPLHIDPSGPGQERIRKLRGVDTAVPVTVTRADGKAFACMVKWKGSSQNFSELHAGEYTGEVNGIVAWYA